MKRRVLERVAEGRVFYSEHADRFQGVGNQRTFRWLRHHGFISVQWAEAPSGYHIAPRIPVALTAKGELELARAGG